MVKVRSHLRKTKKSGLRPVREHWRKNRYVYDRNAVKSVLRKQDDIVDSKLERISDAIQAISEHIKRLNEGNIRKIDKNWANDYFDDDKIKKLFSDFYQFCEDNDVEFNDYLNDNKLKELFDDFYQSYEHNDIVLKDYFGSDKFKELDKLKESFNDFYKFCEENDIVLYYSPYSNWINIKTIAYNLSEGMSYEDVLNDYLCDLKDWANSEEELFDYRHDVGSIYKIANNNDAKNLLVVVKKFPDWDSSQISQIHMCNDYDEAEMLRDKIARGGDFRICFGNLSFRIVKNTDDIVENLVKEYRKDLLNLYDNKHPPLLISTFDHT